MGMAILVFDGCDGQRQQVRFDSSNQAFEVLSDFFYSKGDPMRLCMRLVKLSLKPRPWKKKLQELKEAACT